MDGKSQKMEILKKYGFVGHCIYFSGSNFYHIFRGPF